MIKQFQAAAAKTRHGLVLSALLAAIGLGILGFGRGTVDNHIATGGLALGLAIAMMGHAWWTARRRGPQLRIDDAGVWFKDWDVTVPWKHIEDAYQSGTRLQPFVTLRVRDADALLADLAPDEAKRLHRNRLWRPPELRIPNSLVEGSQREVLDAILAGMVRPRRAADAAR